MFKVVFILFKNLTLYENTPKPKVITTSVLKSTVTFSLLESHFSLLSVSPCSFHTRDLGMSALRRAHKSTVTSLVNLRVSPIFQAFSLYLVNNITHFLFLQIVMKYSYVVDLGRDNMLFSIESQFTGRNKDK